MPAMQTVTSRLSGKRSRGAIRRWRSLIAVIHGQGVSYHGWSLLCQVYNYPRKRGRKDETGAYLFLPPPAGEVARRDKVPSRRRGDLPPRPRAEVEGDIGPAFCRFADRGNAEL